MEQRQNTVLDYIYVVVKWRKFIILFTFLAGVVTAGVSLMLPKWYKATATVLISADSPVSLGISSYINQFGSGAADFLKLGTEEDRYMAILQSRGAQEHIVSMFGLQEIYEAINMEETVRGLRGNVDFGKTRENAIYIDVLDKSEERASDMANAYVDYLDKRNKELQTEQARNNRIFIENRRNKNIEDIKAWEDSLNVFQEKYKVLSLPEQIEAELTTYSDMYSEMQVKKIEYDIARINLSEGNPVLRQLKLELDAYEQNLKRFELSPDNFRDTEYDPGFYVPFEDIPDRLIQFARLQREVETQNVIFEFITQQYELAKFQEARDTPTLQVLDRAVPPVRKAKPKRTILVLIGAGFAFLFAMSVAFTTEYFRRIGGGSPEEQQKVVAIRKMLGRKSARNE